MFHWLRGVDFLPALAMTLSVHHGLALAACAGHLALVVLALARVGRGAAALPCALLYADLFAWNFAALAFDVTGAPAWRYIDVAASPLTGPLVLHLVVALTGQGRRFRVTLAVVYAVFGAISAMCLLAFRSPLAEEFAGSPAWAFVVFCAALLTIVYAIVLLRTHLESETKNPERPSGGRLIFAALVLGAPLATTELLADIGFNVPRLGSIGTLMAAVLVAIAVLRFDVLGSQTSSRQEIALPPVD